MKKYGLYIILAIFGLDQLTKYVVAKTMTIGESKALIDNLFYLTFHKNSGAAWGSFQGKMVFFYLVTVAALAAFYYFLKEAKEQEKFLQLGLILMIGGTIGNFFDRLVFKEVVDFLDFVIFGYDFPIFNVADISLVVGAGFVLLETFMEFRRGKENG